VRDRLGLKPQLDTWLLADDDRR